MQCAINGTDNKTVCLIFKFCVRDAKFRGRHFLGLIKNPVKGAAAVETRFHCYISDRGLGGQQQQFCFVKPLSCKVLGERFPYKILKKPGKIEF